MAPIIVEDAAPDSEITRDEVFGPVLVDSTFKTHAEAIELANASGCGLVANMWTGDLAEGMA